MILCDGCLFGVEQAVVEIGAGDGTGKNFIRLCDLCSNPRVRMHLHNPVAWAVIAATNYAANAILAALREKSGAPPA